MRRALGGPVPRLGRPAIVVQVLLAAAFGAFLLLRQDPHLPWDGSYVVSVELADASGLAGDDHSRVTIAGVDAGRVEDVRYQHGRAVARLRLHDDTKGKLRAGARATVEPRSALNDLVLDLSPGDLHARALRDGDTIPAIRAAGAVQVDQVLAHLDADTRAQVQVLVAELDRAAGGERGGRLAAALRELEPVSASAATVTRRLAERRRALTRLVGDLDTLTTTLATRATDLERAVGAGRRTLDVTAARDRELAATVGALPGTLADVRAALGQVERLAGPLDPALERLRPTARALPGALAALREATPATRGLLADVRTTARRGGAAAHTLRRVLERLGPAATHLDSPARRLGPIVGAIDRNKRGIGLLGDRFSGIFSTSDANGTILRGLGFFEPFDPANFGAPGATGARRARIAADVVRALERTCRRDNQLACLARYLVPGLPGGVRG